MDRTQIIEVLKEELVIELTIEGSRIRVQLCIGENVISSSSDWLDIRRIQNEDNYD